MTLGDPTIRKQGSGIRALGMFKQWSMKKLRRDAWPHTKQKSSEDTAELKDVDEHESLSSESYLSDVVYPEPPKGTAASKLPLFASGCCRVPIVALCALSGWSHEEFCEPAAGLCFALYSIRLMNALTDVDKTACFQHLMHCLLHIGATSQTLCFRWTVICSAS